MSTTDDRVRIGYQGGPEAMITADGGGAGGFDAAAAMAALAACDRFGEYVMYERPGEWVFAADPLGSVELDASELRIGWDGSNSAQPWEGRPANVIDRALAGLPLAGRNAYGWIGFEFCAYTFGAREHLARSTMLAHIMIPRIEVRLTVTGAKIVGGDDDDRNAVRAVLAAPPRTAQPTPRAVDIRVDPTDYRGRVATAIGEIRAGRYDKVILSRSVRVGFPVDLPATYRLGRAHNNPARSFLFRLGGLEATGFSPELVAAVDADGTVTTEPLAGTRAFGRGAAEDLAARLDLESDPKEIVEHAVSVRTSFAEIASVARPGTSSVSDFMAVRERGSVQHLASTVRGRLASDRSCWDALEALFPSVTASGIPKRECVDAIFRLDSQPRGLYSGAVLTISADGALEATLVLRAVYQQGGKAWLRAGAGVIAQSRPEREFEETCEKLGSIAPHLVPRPK